MENGDPESLLAVWDSGGAAPPFIAVHSVGHGRCWNETKPWGALWTVIPAEDGARGGTEDGGMVSQKLRVGSLSV